MRNPTGMVLASALASAMGLSTVSVAVHAAPPASLTAEAVNDAATAASAKGKSSNASMLRAQILLDRAQFSPGEIDGGFGSNTRKAIAGFQRSKGLQASGQLDAETWAALNADAADALVSYTVTAADVAGPFKPIPSDMVEKSKLA